LVLLKACAIVPVGGLHSFFFTNDEVYSPPGQSQQVIQTAEQTNVPIIILNNMLLENA